MFRTSLVDKKPPANARGNGFDSWSGKILHAIKRLRLCSTTTETTGVSYHSLLLV